MPYQRKKYRKIAKKVSVDINLRKKTGMTQAQFAALLGISRPQLTRFESGKRSLDPQSSAMLADMQLQFFELETGRLADYRSLETRLFLNEGYKKVLPKMKALEQEYRRTITAMKKDLAGMKQQATDREHTIILFTRYVHKLTEEGKQDQKTLQKITGFNLFKQEAYMQLLSCWEPEQAKLHARIEALAGEARALRRYRIKIMREHNPLKKA
ncbi:MAG: helix-turn-helix transcriptional regulator [Ferruginibacter sp.]